MVIELGNQRQKRKLESNDKKEFSESIETRLQTGKKLFKATQRAVQYLQNNSLRPTHCLSLKQSLKKCYEGKKDWEQVLYIKKKRLIPFTSEIRRFMLAFECKNQSGIFKKRSDFL